MENNWTWIRKGSSTSSNRWGHLIWFVLVCLALMLLVELGVVQAMRNMRCNQKQFAAFKLLARETRYTCLLRICVHWNLIHFRKPSVESFPHLSASPKTSRCAVANLDVFNVVTFTKRDIAIYFHSISRRFVNIECRRSHEVEGVVKIVDGKRSKWKKPSRNRHKNNKTWHFSQTLTRGSREASRRK